MRNIARIATYLTGIPAAQLLALILVAVCAVNLTACNTTEGVGKDVKALGAGIEDAAKDAKD